MKKCNWALGALMALLVTACGADTLSDIQPAQNLDDYRALSQRLQALDREAFARELAQARRDQPLAAKYADRFGFDPRQRADFYRTPAGRQIADNVLSYQTPSGGWSKRTDMGRAPRAPGQLYGVEKNYIPTFDNDATSVQFWVMVAAHRATGDARYARAAERALRLVLLAQYPNGGWPQSFPLRGKYHDDVTYNDKVICNLLEVLSAVAEGDDGTDFLPADLRKHAAAALARGLQMVVETQVVSGGQRTLWAAQYDPQTLEPAAARAFEPAGLATSESADLLLFLMKLDKPSAEIRRAIVSAHKWIAAQRIDGYHWGRGEHDYRELLPDPDGDPLWARFYEIGSDKPVFGDRDGKVYYDVRQISAERSRNYGWYTESPNKVLKKFDAWQRHHGGALQVNEN